ncbi:hypothetical protein UlMin_026636 [Ulmus minor]
MSWYYVIKENQIKRIKRPNNNHHVPMLLIPIAEEKHLWTIYDIMNNKFLKSKLDFPYDKRFKRFCGSSGGWLMAVNDDYTLSLYKPYINTSIQLPSIFSPPPIDEDLVYDDSESEGSSGGYEPLGGHEYHILKFTITTDPLENPNDCVVMVIHGETYQFAFIRPAKDTTWTKFDVPAQLDEILTYDNHIFGITLIGGLLSFDVSNTCNTNVKIITNGDSSWRGYYIKNYIVNSCRGDLLQVERYLDWDNDEGRVTKKFKVLKFDFDTRMWIEIKCLGEESLFLGDNSSISILASNFVGCQPNSIYFTNDEDTVRINVNGLIDVGVYNIETGSSTLHFNIDLSCFTKMYKRAPIWVVPTLNLY